MFFFLAALIVTFTSCRKLIDRYFPGHHGGQHTDCRITSITSGEVQYQVKYNSSGKIDSIVSDLDPVSDDVHVIFMTYDSLGKLTALRRTKGQPDGINAFHRYGYSGDKITTDTIFETSTSTYRVWLSRLTYDSSDRITSETIEIIYSDIEGESPFLFNQYWYDANGNLIQPVVGNPEILYSDYTNPLRTDKTLQFLARDYSRNAPIGATGFNRNNLPTAFAQPYLFNFNPPTGIRQSIIVTTAMTYSCE